MRAAQVFGIDDIRFVSDAPMPKPDEHDALIQTSMASICGSDLHMAGMGWQMPEYPAPPGHPGHEAVGIVLQPPKSYPENLSGDILQEGDLVLTVPHIWYSFCFAEYMTVNANHILKLPAGMPVEHLLMTQQLGTVLFASRRLPESLEGKTCVVIGQGSAGLFWDFILKRKRASKIIAIEPLVHRRNLAEAYGADHTIGIIGDEANQAVLEMTDGEGPDIVVEAVGSTATLSQAFHIVKPEGTCVLFGLPESNDPVPFDYTEMFKKRVNAYTILGAQEEPGLVTFRETLAIIAEAEIDMTPIVTHRFPIEEVTQAFQLAKTRNSNAVKIALTF